MNSPPAESHDGLQCPRCQEPGKRVGEETVKSLLRGPALERRREGVHRFCPRPACEVIYFGESEAFHRHEVTVPVFQKEPEGNRLFCYCLEITEDEIGRGGGRGRKPDPIERIRTLVRGGRCACEWKAPEGVCCLGNLSHLRRKQERG